MGFFIDKNYVFLICFLQINGFVFMIVNCEAEIY